MPNRSISIVGLAIAVIVSCDSSSSETSGPFGAPGISQSEEAADTDAPQAASLACTNTRPTGTLWDEATCDQWASETQECNQQWMVYNHYCDQSCGRCGSTEVTPLPVSTPTEVRKFVGNITTGDQVNAGGLNFASHWDQITPENAGKWGSVQYTAGASYNWATLDAIYDYTQENGILFKQHAFVWGSQQPGGNISEQNVRDWIRSFCSRYPNTKIIDVVNEPPPHTEPNYANAIGGGTHGNWQWITNSFKWARESCPNAILILNDYNNIEWSNETQHFINIVNTVRSNGGPIDAIGAQAHDLDHPSVSTSHMKQLVQKLHDDTGLDVYITEYDISTSDDSRQLQLYQEHIPYFLQTDFIKGVTIWGWIYGQTWSQASESGLVRNGGSRPAMTWLMQTLGRPVP